MKGENAEKVFSLQNVSANSELDIKEVEFEEIVKNIDFTFQV